LHNLLEGIQARAHIGLSTHISLLIDNLKIIASKINI